MAEQWSKQEQRKHDLLQCRISRALSETYQNVADVAMTLKTLRKGIEFSESYVLLLFVVLYRMLFVMLDSLTGELKYC